ncbi:MAG: tRNA pseudouridine(55) synthase TruB [Oscillospiraceae bacterium]|jgi:tRNA pseudouridine55 synthase|nr:tRNA pseudouridine(55) synthase TruB [Oscillospiraceae bacterium]
MSNGILIIDKPAEFTSFDVIAKLRGMLKIRKLGHGGTLDPMATGVLPILAGTATKAMDILPIGEKEYIAGFKLGLRTDTQDITGRVLSEQLFHVKQSEFLPLLSDFTGDIMQTPPMYSAVQVNGVRLYDLARQGVEVERKARACTIHSLELLDFNEEQASGTLKLLCSRGTYVRTIIADIGERLGCGAALTSLRRTLSAGFSLEGALTLKEAQDKTDEGTLHSFIQPIDIAFKVYPAVEVSQKQAIRFLNGGALSLDYISFESDAAFHRLYDPQGAFLGLGEADIEKVEMKVYKLFGRP